MEIIHTWTKREVRLGRPNTIKKRKKKKQHNFNFFFYLLLEKVERCPCLAVVLVY
jgi:hypothetical protein